MWDRWVKVSIALVVGCAIGVGLVVLYRPGAAQMRELDAQVDQMRAANDELETDKRGFKNRKLLLEHDPLTLEVEARGRFRLIKEGETVYIVKDWPLDSPSKRQ